MKKTFIILFLSVYVFGYTQTHNSQYEQMKMDSTAMADSMAKAMEQYEKDNSQNQTHPNSKEQQIQDSIAAALEAAKMEAEIKKVMDEMTKASEEVMKIFKDTAYVDSLRKANKDFSFVGSWRGSIQNEEVTFVFFKDSTWRAHSSKDLKSDIAGTWYNSSDSLFLEGTETKKNDGGQSKKKPEKIYMKYLPYTSKEAWLYMPFIKEKIILKKQL